MEKKFNLHHKPDPLVLEQYPDLIYSISNSRDGAQALARYKMYLETPIIGCHWKQSELIESVAADTATVCAHAELLGHVLTTERSHGHTRYAKDLTSAVETMWKKVQFVTDMVEMHRLKSDIFHDHKLDIRARTSNVRLHQQHYAFAELCENPNRMRLKVKSAKDSITQTMLVLRNQLEPLSEKPSRDAQYCLSELGPQLMERLEGMRSNLLELDKELRTLKQPIALQQNGNPIQSGVGAVDSAIVQDAIRDGRVVDFSAFREQKANLTPPRPSTR